MIEKELEKAFGLSFELSEKVEKSGLPRYLVTGRTFFKVQYEEFIFYIIRLRGATDSRVLYKEMMLYQEKFNAPVAFWFEELTKNNRNAYVKHHIPFIMIPTQIYLPFLGMLFSKKLSGNARKNSLRLSFNAQKILFYLMYNKKDGYSKGVLAKNLELDPVYITRGTKELVSRKFAIERKDGRNTLVELTLDPKEIMKSGDEIFVNPVSAVIYVKRTAEVKALLKASDYALSEISMLNPPSIGTYACYKKDGIIAGFEVVEEPEWEDSRNICRIELWNYDPKQLSNKDMVDELSLYCSLKDTKDPRVQGEIEKVLEEIEWQ